MSELNENRINYVVVMDSDYGDFANKVEKLLGAGWKLQGGIAVRTNDEGYATFYQALTK
jgi:hypothetical protein